MSIGIEFRNVTKRYGADASAALAVKGISFQVEHGTLVTHPRSNRLRQDDHVADDRRS